jgi:cytochrome c oxidase assembly protein subunit 15
MEASRLPARRRLSLRRLPTISPALYTKVAVISLASLVLIVWTGAAVRLTGSGLGCPDWPKCYGRVVAPLETHAVIEFTNRMLSGFVGLAVIAAGALAWLRRPFRGHLALFGALLPIGVVGQAVLGGLVVRYHLAPGLVMSHFILSMILLDAAFALAWCSRYEPGERARSTDRAGVWSVRALVPIGQVTILLGTIATASGPHAGAHSGQLVKRFHFEGTGTLAWMVNRHGLLAAIFGIAAIGVWLLLRRPGGERRAVRPLTAMLVLLALQGALGIVQYQLKLPAELVWVHIALATLTWLCTLWAVARAGRLAPRGAAQPAGDPAPSAAAEPAAVGA